jgi:hypothetical protein
MEIEFKRKGNRRPGGAICSVKVFKALTLWLGMRPTSELCPSGFKNLIRVSTLLSLLHWTVAYSSYKQFKCCEGCSDIVHYPNGTPIIGIPLMSVLAVRFK